MFRKILSPFARLFDLQARTHYRTERHSMALTFGIILAAGVGGFVEIAPLFTIDDTVEAAPDMRVYTPLEQAGRDIYVREGCYACHSQMIRTLQDEVDRYGPYSLAVESKYDHPMLWGSKRTGPDLARLGQKYSDDWHLRHLIDPRAVVPESVMPQYAFLLDKTLDTESLPARLAALRAVGVPYTDAQIDNAAQDARGQARPFTEGADGVIDRYGDDTNIRVFSAQQDRVSEMDALIAYLQILGGLTDAAERTQPAGAQDARAAVAGPAPQPTGTE
ncbi:cytochrome-c oxidase, cbb3-type subunit II [Mesobaculum littorinae]|uniref:Cytochrome-c oxidase, cbb3-type subunit II n=1 Tax=Mesobaculum littorinae TaxID=2486419 RepID=A0A438ADG7_9RHOB|nr:cytochrome-c oxidase, cbb3-type subunit II [Mesobaculum littorinae]RVV96715.1 cytochrome-c oxidase, cbb3-type subunit II [Mesobaculum littorinae]